MSLKFVIYSKSVLRHSAHLPEF